MASDVAWWREWYASEMCGCWGVSEDAALDWIVYADEHREAEVAYAVCLDHGGLHGILWILPLVGGDVCVRGPVWSYRQVVWVPTDKQLPCWTVKRGGFPIGRAIDLARRARLEHWLREYDVAMCVGENIRAGRGLCGFFSKVGIERYFEVTHRLNLEEFRSVGATSILLDAKSGLAIEGNGFGTIRYACVEPEERPAEPLPGHALYWECQLPIWSVGNGWARYAAGPAPWVDDYASCGNRLLEVFRTALYWQVRDSFRPDLSCVFWQ